MVISHIEDALGQSYNLTQSVMPWVYYCHEPSWVRVNTDTRVIHFASEVVCDSVARELGDLVVRKGCYYLTYGV